MSVHQRGQGWGVEYRLWHNRYAFTARPKHSNVNALVLLLSPFFLPKLTTSTSSTFARSVRDCPQTGTIRHFGRGRNKLRGGEDIRTRKHPNTSNTKLRKKRILSWSMILYTRDKLNTGTRYIPPVDYSYIVDELRGDRWWCPAVLRFNLIQDCRILLLTTAALYSWRTKDSCFVCHLPGTRYRKVLAFVYRLAAFRCAFLLLRVLINSCWLSSIMRFLYKSKIENWDNKKLGLDHRKKTNSCGVAELEN